MYRYICVCLIFSGGTVDNDDADFQEMMERDALLGGHSQQREVPLIPLQPDDDADEQTQPWPDEYDEADGVQHQQTKTPEWDDGVQDVDVSDDEPKMMANIWAQKYKSGQLAWRGEVDALHAKKRKLEVVSQHTHTSPTTQHIYIVTFINSRPHTI